jgi:DNA mismatch repair protein MutL
LARICKLDAALVGLIAAGEVVERPASVVKELVENALDAGASRISVEVEEAGRRLIRVSDDGEGMLPEDALLALERHATSKIRSRADLGAIATLGFRGEALPAIASVSRFELVSAPRGGSAAVRLRVEGAEAPRAEAAARGPGTTVAVRDLFFATPARRKFLKSDATELRRLVDAVVEAGLAHPDVAFEVRSGGREVLSLPAAATLGGRLASLYGADYAAALLPVAARAEPRQVAGLVQRPDAAGRGARRQMLFVNCRPVQDRALAQAALRGYASTVPPGAFPQFFLFLSLPPETVDVNVHPAKREVRFREPDLLFGLVQAAVRDALGGLRSAAGLEPGRRFRRVPAGSNRADGSGGAEGREPVQQAAGSGAGVLEARGGYRMPREDQLGLFLNARLREREADGFPGEPRGPRLWQLHDTFVLAQTGTGLAIIDQHSAHERVLYERILAAFERESPASQELVFPHTYQLGPSEWQAWEENRELFERLGFVIEPFGERTLALRTLPALGPGFHPEEAFLELLGDLSDTRGVEPSQHQRVAKTLACRGAIKAGQPLGPEEMARLFNDLFATRLPTADVHGRPAVVQIPLEDLVRRFDRA